MSFTNPAPGAQRGRIDAGVDWSGVTRIVAVAAGTIVNIYQNLSGFGQTVIERLRTGQYIYYAEETSGVHTSVHTGQSVSAGQQIAGGGSGGVIEAGFWNPGTGTSIGTPQFAATGQPSAAGRQFASDLSGGGSGGPSYATMIQNAARKYNVPPNILIGVFGMETDFGQNISTSSAGAIGLMQFLPSTARQWHYPLTNSPNATQAQAQFNAAAAFLSSLYKQYGNWNTALEHYSGGGYGLAQVQAKAKQAGSALKAGASGYGGTRGSSTASGSSGSSQANTQGVSNLWNKYVAMRDDPNRSAPPQVQALTIPASPQTPPMQASALWWLAAFRQNAMKVFGG